MFARSKCPTLFHGLRRARFWSFLADLSKNILLSRHLDMNPLLDIISTLQKEGTISSTDYKVLLDSVEKKVGAYFAISYIF